MTADPTRIPRIMRKLEALWRARPECELRYLLSLMYGTRWFAEGQLDDELEVALDRQLSALGVRVENHNLTELVSLRDAEHEREKGELRNLLSRWASQHSNGGPSDPCGVAAELVEETRACLASAEPATTDRQEATAKCEPWCGSRSQIDQTSRWCSLACEDAQRPLFSAGRAVEKCETCKGIRIVPIYDPRGYTGDWKSCPTCGGTGQAKPRQDGR